MKTEKNLQNLTKLLPPFTASQTLIPTNPTNPCPIGYYTEPEGTRQAGPEDKQAPHSKQAAGGRRKPPVAEGTPAAAELDKQEQKLEEPQEHSRGLLGGRALELAGVGSGGSESGQGRRMPGRGSTLGARTRHRERRPACRV